MVIYDLQCSLGHRFEAWFKDALAFEAQKKQGLVQCAVCGTTQVSRIPAGCHVGSVVEKKKLKTASKQKKSTQTNPDAPLAFDPVLLIKSINKYVKENCKDVGETFAEKAIEMHYAKIPQEPIYGTASPEQKEMLDDEGVSYLNIPAIPESLDN